MKLQIRNGCKDVWSAYMRTRASCSGKTISCHVSTASAFEGRQAK